MAKQAEKERKKYLLMRHCAVVSMVWNAMENPDQTLAAIEDLRKRGTEAQDGLSVACANTLEALFREAVEIIAAHDEGTPWGLYNPMEN